MKRVLLFAVVTSAIIATGVIIASLQFQEDPWVDPGDPLDLHSEDLPTTAFHLIVDGGPSGTLVIGSLEFGFVNGTWDYTPGFYSDYLRVHDGYNKSPVSGLSYSEVRDYSFAYLGETKLYDDWTNRTPGSTSSPGEDNVAWTPNSKDGRHYGGHLPLENRSDLTMAGYVIEFEELSVHFADGSSFLCGPEVLSIGVNFTRANDSWETNYIIEATDYSGVVTGANSVILQLSDEVPDKTNDTTEPEPTHQQMGGIGVGVLLFPAAVAIVVGSVILVAAKKGLV